MMTATTLSSPSVRLPAISGRRIVLTALAALILVFTADALWPRRVDFRQFDPLTIGRLDAAMWRSYYERRPVRLFWQLAQSLRVQFHTGFVRSFPIAYRAAKAAFTFKDGRNRADYARAAPDLERYFAAISGLARDPFNARIAARDDLEWWIVRREPEEHTTNDWKRLIAAVASEVYHTPAAQLAEYAHLRVEAMVLRDGKGAQISEDDWAHIGAMLEQSWGSLAEAVRVKEP
jgi:hypothetical protein